MGLPEGLFCENGAWAYSAGSIWQSKTGTHNTSVQLRLSFHTPECYQGTAIPIPHYVILQNTVQLCRCPAPSGICLVGEPQLILHVVGNPLCKRGGQLLESGVVHAQTTLPVPLVCPCKH